ncbi:MAG: hypothetical protein RLN69_00745 [Woeseiaceae bacterium]
MAFAALFALAACGDPPSGVRTASGGCGADGRFAGQLYGSLEATLAWGKDDLLCHGMPRPNGAGARLRFAGSVTSASKDVPIVFILGIPDLQRGQAGKELLTNVTVINESQGRFFATQDIEACWSDVESQVEIAGGDEYEVRGILYCVSPLAELHGPGSIRFSDLQFTGLLDWNPPQ